MHEQGVHNRIMFTEPCEKRERGDDGTTKRFHCEPSGNDERHLYHLYVDGGNNGWRTLHIFAGIK